MGIAIWIFTLPVPDECPNPPEKATLNFWQVMYSSQAEPCRDYPLIEAGLKGGDFPRSQEEWERGLEAHADDEISALVYVNNDAADNAEILHPGKGIARNARLYTEISEKPTAIHYIKAIASGKNTKAIEGSFKITTNDDECLEIVPASGEIFHYRGGELMATDLDVGNNTIALGDNAPLLKSSLFVRFKIKVSNAPCRIVHRT